MPFLTEGRQEFLGGTLSRWQNSPTRWISRPSCRWRAGAGFGGAVNPQGPGFEAYTWAAGIAASTPKAGVISTSHITINHPIIAAKQCAVIDHISNGRFTLNIVCGWNGPEMAMFG